MPKVDRFYLVNWYDLQGRHPQGPYSLRYCELHRGQQQMIVSEKQLRDLRSRPGSLPEDGRPRKESK